MDLETIQKSKGVTRTLIGLGIVAVIGMTFGVGTMMGYHKARFAENYGNNYERNFFGGQNEQRGAGRDRGFMGGMMGDFQDRFDLPSSGNGATGEVVSVSFPNFVVIDRDGLEKVITVSNNTIIRKFRENATTTDIQVGSVATVLGDANNSGIIEAKFIRVMPSAKVEPVKQNPSVIPSASTTNTN